MTESVTPDPNIRKAVAALRESDERYRRLVEGIRRYAILMFDSDGIVLTWNQGVRTMLGYTREDILGKSISIIYTAKQRDADALKAEMAKAIRDRDVEQIRACLRKDGTEVLGHETTTALRANQKVFGFAKVIRLLADSASHTASELEQILATLHVETERRKHLEAALLTAVEVERQRLGQDLHDDLSQRLTGISLMIRAIAQKMEGKEPGLRREMRKVTKLLTEANDCARHLAHGLNPVTLSKRGLPAALEELASRVPDNVTFRWPTSKRLDLEDSVALHLYRIAEEALSNALKHSGADLITIEIDTAGEAHTLVICDNGKGFRTGAERRAGMGLRNMQYRADTICATLTIESTPKGGTCIRCSIPVRKTQVSLGG